MKSVALSIILSSYLSAQVLVNVDYAQSMYNLSKTQYDTYAKGVITYQGYVDKYTAYYNATTNQTVKDAYAKSIASYQKTLDLYKANLIIYTDKLKVASTNLDDTKNFYAPKPVVTVDPKLIPYIPDAKPIVPTTTSYEYTKTFGAYSIIGVEGAWNQGYTGKGVTVADIDTGISNKNSDLSRFLTKDNIIDFGYKYNQGDTKTFTRTVLGYGNISDIAVNTITLVTPKKYTVAPTVEIIGNGTGAKAQAVIDSTGKVTGIQMTDFGVNYTGSVQVILRDQNGNIDTSYDIIGHLAGIDYNSHGTGVASLMVGAFNNTGIVGVAYDANLIVVKAGDSSLTTSDIVDGARLAVDRGATIINQSFESAYAMTTQTVGVYKDLLKAGTVIVNAAGNAALDCKTTSSCNTWATIPLTIGKDEMSKASGAFIVVGALDTTGTDIAYYSNRAGVTKDYYILAPGSSIGTSSLEGYNTAKSGTSFASPIVAGTMALLQQKWPRLSGAQQAQILFQTADDMGVAGVDDIYGWGKLNVTKAFSPVGDLKVPTIVSSITGLSSSVKLSPVTTFANGSSLITAKLASFGALNDTVSFDSFQRDYQVNMTSYVSVDKQAFAFDQFVYMPLGKSGLQVGINNIYNAVSVGYKSGSNILNYSRTNDVLGSSGSGLLGYNGHTDYINYSYNTISNNTGVNLGLTYAHASVSSNDDSLISMSNIDAVGVTAKALYNGFGATAYIPSKIISGTVTAHTPSGSDTNGNIVYSDASMDLSKGAFERTVGLVYEQTYGLNNYGIEFSKTYDSYNIENMNSNNIKIKGTWYF